MDQISRKFNTRAFVALGMVFAGLGLPVTGVVNHLYGLAPMTVTRHAWMSAHNILGLLFVVFAIWHVVLNRRALWSHLRSGAARVPAFSREVALAGSVVGLLLLLFVGHAFHVGN